MKCKYHSNYIAAVMLLGLCLLLVSCSRKDRQEPAPAPDLAAPTQTEILAPTIITVTVPITVYVPVTITVPVTVPGYIQTPQPPPSRCTNANKEDSDEILIGILVPLFQPGSAAESYAMQTAANLAMQQVEKDNGILNRQVRLITGDTGGVPEQGASVAESLITRSCVIGLIGVYHDEVGDAVKEVAHKYGVPIIFTTPQDDSITISQYPEVFRISPSTTLLAQRDSQWLSQLGDYNGDNELFVVPIIENTAYGAKLHQNVEQWYAQYGIDFRTLLVDLPTRDFSSVIARLVSMERVPDVLLIDITGNAAYDLHQQLLEAGIGPAKDTLIVTRAGALAYTEFWEKIPDGVDSIVTYTGPWYGTVSTVGLEFSQIYSQFFAHWPEAHAFATYDAFLLMADAIERAGTLASEDIIQALETADIELASGRYTFPYNSKNPPDGEIVPLHMWHQWPDPPLLFLQYTKPKQNSAEMDVIWPEIYRHKDRGY